VSFAIQKRKIIREGTPKGFEALLVVLLTLSIQSKRAETFRFSREVFLIF